MAVVCAYTIQVHMIKKIYDQFSVLKKQLTNYIPDKRINTTKL